MNTDDIKVAEKLLTGIIEKGSRAVVVKEFLNVLQYVPENQQGAYLERLQSVESAVCFQGVKDDIDPIIAEYAQYFDKNSSQYSMTRQIPLWKENKELAEHLASKFRATK